MTKIGLKETLALLAAGYKKKDIEALAANDDEQETPPPAPAPAPAQETPPPAPAPAPKEETPDNELEQVKAQLDDTLKKLKESEDKVKELQKENINKDSTSDLEKAREEQKKSLTGLFASFM